MLPKKCADKRAQQSIVKSKDFFIAVHPHVFVNGVGEDEANSIQLYTTNEIDLHNKAFHKQLKFRFPTTRQKNVIVSQGLCNTAEVDY